MIPYGIIIIIIVIVIIIIITQKQTLHRYLIVPEAKQIKPLSINSITNNPTFKL